VVIAGRPNAGKSSLLNALAGKDIAIVTNIAGTTRDVLKEHIQIDGMPLHIIDTAGLRESPDEVERIGIQRAWNEIQESDRILLIIDCTDPEQLDPVRHWPEFFEPDRVKKLTLVYNKVDQNPLFAIPSLPTTTTVRISAKTGLGLDELKSHLKRVMSYSGTLEGGFSARRRHLDALIKASNFVKNGLVQLQEYSAGELLAEDLKQAQEQLSQITGTFTADDLLGAIFSSFCIGK
jgi:tRNA modification GTPase